MSKIKKPTLINWGTFALLYLLFLWWHGTFEEPLNPEEIDYYVEKLKKISPEADTASIRHMLRKNSGKPIIMVNAIKLRDEPISVNQKEVGDNSEAALRKYGFFVANFLIRRGSYPIYVGEALGPAVAMWGIDNGRDWSSAACVRYRSVRVLLDMAINPRFRDKHDFKLAAIEKTIAYPTYATLHVANLAVLVFFILLSMALGGQLLIVTRQKR